MSTLGSIRSTIYSWGARLLSTPLCFLLQWGMTILLHRAGAPPFFPPPILARLRSADSRAPEIHRFLSAWDPAILECLRSADSWAPEIHHHFCLGFIHFLTKSLCTGRHFVLVSFIFLRIKCPPDTTFVLFLGQTWVFNQSEYAPSFFLARLTTGVTLFCSACLYKCNVFVYINDLLF